MPSKIKDNAENDEEKEHGTAAQASQPARTGEPAAKSAPALSAAEWEAKAEAAGTSTRRVGNTHGRRDHTHQERRLGRGSEQHVHAHR